MAHNALYGNEGTEEEYVGVKNLLNLYSNLNGNLDTLEGRKTEAEIILNSDFKGTADTL